VSPIPVIFVFLVQFVVAYL